MQAVSPIRTHEHFHAFFLLLQQSRSHSSGLSLPPHPLSVLAAAKEEEEEEEEDETEEKEEEENGGHAPSLGEFFVSEATRDSVRLSWIVPSGIFDSFLIQYKDAEDQAQALPVDGGSREATIPNLIPSHRYRFDLYGLSQGKHLGPVSTDVSTGQQHPPSHLAPKSKGHGFLPCLS